MTVLGRRALLGTAASAGFVHRARAQSPGIRIGVLTALSGEYTDAAGGGSVIAAKLAVEDFVREHKPSFRIDILSGDMLDKPDVGLAVARGWFDADAVDMISDVPNSAIALAVSGLVKERDKVVQISAGSSTVTGQYCTPNSMQLAYNTYALGKVTGSALYRQGGKTWSFISADYAFGQALVQDTANTITGLGGKVLGNARFPFPSNGDFSSYLLQAQATGADVIAMATAGGDTTNAIKQAHEFGLIGGRQRVVGLLTLITNIHALGLDQAQGLIYSDPFYWDSNDATRAFSARFQPQWRDLKPSEDHAGVYAGVIHYLKAVQAIGVDKARASGRAAMEQMKRMPTDDAVFGKGAVRPDGQMVHDMHLWQVKSPKESKSPWDYSRLLATVPATEAFIPLSQSTCAAARG